MWSIDGNELQNLKGAGGERFTRFVDALIRAEANTGGLSPSDIDTQIRVNVQDRGVDTRIRAAVPQDQSGFLSVPTCWQYKAQTYKEVKKSATKSKPFKFLENEFSKDGVKKFVKEGHAYRYCLLGDVPPDKIDEWERFLEDEAKKLNPVAPPPRVVDAGKLIGWAQRFPAVVGLVRPWADTVHNLDWWRAQGRKFLPEYVSIEQWAGQEQAIKYHLAFGNKRADVCLPVQGEAGVGKTRLVLECVSDFPGADALVVYTCDENTARTVADRLSGNSMAKAIVVADECSVRFQVAIEDTLAGCADRVRVICINNTGKRSATGAPEIWLEEMPAESALVVLEKNFNEVPSDRRHGYVDLARGFLRLAADMCRQDSKLSAGDFTPALMSVENYIRARISNQTDAMVLDALALVPKVGAKDDLEPQLESLCKATGLTPKEVRGAVERIKDAPGFITVAGRFLYVTPSIVAKVAFARAWKRWIEDDPTAFVDCLGDELTESFLEQVKAVGEKEVQRIVADKFCDWMISIEPESLVERTSAERIARIVETNPEQYLPVLRRTIDGAAADVLRRDDGFGSRRTLVWLCERLGAFREFYVDAEAVLFKLALNEIERIGNNATGIWKQFQRIRMSGSDLPFPERFDILRKRIDESDDITFGLCLSGFEEVFSSHYSRVLGPFTVGSRIRPTSWLPTTVGEERNCWRLAIQVLETLLQAADQKRRSLSAKVLVEHSSELLRQGFLNELRRMLAGDVDFSVRMAILSSTEKFLRRTRDNDPVDDREAYEKYLADVEIWLEELRPDDFSGRLRSLVSRSPWDETIRSHSGDSSPQIMAIAQAACDDPRLLDDQYEWLLSGEAKSASLFGNALGQTDKEAVFVEPVLDVTTQIGEGGLARGYLYGLARSHADLPNTLPKQLDRLESSHPHVAVDLYAVVGDPIDGLNRAFNLANRQAITSATLVAFGPGVGSRQLTVAEFCAILERIVDADDDNSLPAAIRFISNGLRDKDVLDEHAIQTLAWRIVEKGTIDSTRRCAHEWFEVVERLGASDSDRAAKLLAQNLGRRFHDESKRLLEKLAPDHPQAVFRAFVDALMDTDKGPYLQVDNCTDLVAALPEELVLVWIRNTGMNGVRKIARHIPVPYLSNDGTPIVPRLTDEFLQDYGADEQVFNSFVAGTYGTEVWWGSGAGLFRSQADKARRFLSHSNKHVREWAKCEIRSREEMARREQREDEERFLP